MLVIFSKHAYTKTMDGLKYDNIIKAKPKFYPINEWEQFVINDSYIFEEHIQRTLDGLKTISKKDKVRHYD